MKQVRLGVFETNSSSTHSMTICSEVDFNLWVKGKYLLDVHNEKLVDKATLTQEDLEEGNYQTRKEWSSSCSEENLKKYTTTSGEVVVCFGGEVYN